MLAKLIGMIGLKLLAKKIALIILEKVVWKEIRGLVKNSDNKVDDEIADVVIDTVTKAVEKF
jgi:hypothetical protein